MRDVNWDSNLKFSKLLHEGQLFGPTPGFPGGCQFKFWPRHTVFQGPFLGLQLWVPVQTCIAKWVALRLSYAWQQKKGKKPKADAYFLIHPTWLVKERDDGHPHA
jgi:hypothetical protein